MTILIDRTRHKYGRLTVLARAPNRCGKTAWWCLCECGNTLSVLSNNLHAGTRSCGCYPRERSTTHGHTAFGRNRPSRTYSSWYAMKARCSNPKNLRWKHYGGRGIRVCERWLKFENFLADMGERPSRMTLDRIDVNGHYEPSNCRWADAITQTRNRRALTTDQGLKGG